MVIPPTPPKELQLTPKEALPIPPGSTEPPQISAPAGLPGLSLKDVIPPSGPTLPAAGSGGPGLPATPVSRFRPQ